ncbi:hypothetical protein [Roseisolibacter agri]|uniref:Uncharacterized protein n=1 Tax=Roseisolibacter agri TaxID=2014610 RepID=A0AA37Q8C3_9BACT|nr:hypothetical protein [Roseisolibacter agri]GLC28445.1 hypothetical protein rosag_49580 [Roseisolibacter agri]
MDRRRLLGIALALAGASTSLGAQAPGGGCTYDACALRREGVFFSQRILAGVDGRVVARQGFAGFRLDSALATSPRAMAEARIHRREAGVAGVLLLAGSVLGAVALIDASRDGVELSNTRATMLVAGAGMSLVGGWRAQIADRALNRALWWYNRDLPR